MASVSLSGTLTNPRAKMTYTKSTLEAMKRMGFNHPDYDE